MLEDEQMLVDGLTQALSKICGGNDTNPVDNNRKPVKEDGNKGVNAITMAQIEEEATLAAAVVAAAAEAATSLNQMEMKSDNSDGKQAKVLEDDKKHKRNKLRKITFFGLFRRKKVNNGGGVS